MAYDITNGINIYERQGEKIAGSRVCDFGQQHGNMVAEFSLNSGTLRQLKLIKITNNSNTQIGLLIQQLLRSLFLKILIRVPKFSFNAIY